MYLTATLTLGNLKMNLIQKSIIASLIALGVNTSASAATYNVSNSILMGAYDVNVDGTFYDVVFRDGTLGSAYNGTFTTLASASAASQALLDQVFNKGDIYDTNQARTNGCGVGGPCFISTGYLNSFGNASLSYITNVAGTGTDTKSSGTFFSASFDTARTTAETLAFWTKKATSPAATAVPEPEVYAMMLAGLGLIGFAAHNKKKSRNRKVLSQG